MRTLTRSGTGSGSGTGRRRAPRFAKVCAVAAIAPALPTQVSVRQSRLTC